MRPVLVCGFASVLFLQSCGNDPRVTNLQNQVQDLKKTVTELKDTVDQLKGDNSVNEFVRDSEGVAYLTPGDSGYSTIKSTSNFGFLTVSLTNVEPYANGSRIKLKFGNPTNATLADVSATIDWGSVDAKGSPLNDQEKTKTVEFREKFNAGHWIFVTVVLEGVPPTSLGFVRVRELKNKAIILSM